MKLSALSLALTLHLTMAATPVSADAPVTVSPAGRAAMAPELAIGSDGAVYLIWLERTPQGEALAAAGAASSAGHTHLAETDLWFAASTDDGRRFSAPTRVNTTPGEVWGFPVSKPRILVSRDGTLHVFYPGNAVDEGSGKAIVLPRYSRSTDGGQSFAAPRTLGAIPTSDNSALVSGGLANAECFGTMTSDDRGDVYLSRSTDGGRSFGPALLLHPGALVSDAPVLAVLRGTVIAAWHAKVGGDRRIFASVSRNRGQTFSPPVEIAVPGGTGSYPVMVPRGRGLQLAWQQGDTVVTRYLTTNELLPAKRTAQATW